MFIGGKRTTQKGYHKKYDNLPKNFKNTLNKYRGTGVNSKSDVFSIYSHEVLACELIRKIFNKNKSYKTKTKDMRILDVYNMNNIYKYF